MYKLYTLYLLLKPNRNYSPISIPKLHQFFRSQLIFFLLNTFCHFSTTDTGAEWWLPVEGAYWKHPTGPGSSVKEKAGHPAVHISYNDAALFCKDRNSRLPTEEEWEFAARGGLRGKWKFAACWRDCGVSESLQHMGDCKVSESFRGIAG